MLVQYTQGQMIAGAVAVLVIVLAMSWLGYGIGYIKGYLIGYTERLQHEEHERAMVEELRRMGVE